jgi:Cu/Ag efflux protein CusF
MKRLFVVLAVITAPLLARAETPLAQTETVELSATIEAIDNSQRLVALKDGNGTLRTIYAGPEVKRFDELKVGDTVTMQYVESVAFAIRKAGEPGAAAASGETISRGTGSRPSATIARQETATVTIKAIDAKAPAVTVMTDDGRTASFRVDNKKHLNGVGVGDKVEITYTKAFMVSVK